MSKTVPDNEMRARYRKVRVNGKQMSLHRHVLELKLGRSLLPDEVCHHINGNKLDNRPENLIVMSVSEHSRLENLGKKLTEEHKMKLSISGKGKHHKGYAHSPEHKAKVSASMKIARALRFWSTKPK